MTLIDGRRSVSGVQGSAAVDISSVPTALVERVEVLTGGASAVYGADAVSGVVNFILKDDFEGLEVNAFAGANDSFDGEQFSISGTYGKNFDNDRGNVVISLTAATDAGLRYRDSDQQIGGTASSGGEWQNPARRFQNGEITAGATPNLAQFYNFNNTGRFRYGFQIPDEAEFISNYTDEFGSAPSLTQAERDLFARAANAPARTVIDQPVFSVTSGYGVIGPGNAFDFTGFNAINGIDLDGNGHEDCLDSFVGFNSSASGFGFAGGCWTVQQDGTIRPFQNGVITGNFNGGSGDSVFDTSDDFLVPSEDRLSGYFKTDYDLNATTTAFAEASVSFAEVAAPPGTPFFDLLLGAPDNPYLPQQFQALAQQTNGISLTIDPRVFTNTEDTDKRLTTRFVGGVEGEFANGFDYEVSATYGRFERDGVDRDNIIMDRFFAAIDAVEDPNTGNIVCRSTLDPSAVPPSTPFNIPAYDGGGIYSFTPGANSPCVPLNIWAGETGVTQEALDFITARDETNVEIDQLVLSGIISGDTEDFLTLPGGAINFVVGAEYRRERSQVTYSDLRLGIIPEGAPLAGQNIADVTDDPNDPGDQVNSSLLFRPALDFANTDFDTANFDVTEIFGEVSIPIVSDEPLFEALVFDAAARLSDYSNIGMTSTWKVGTSWTPVDDIRFRGTYSRAVRAPNIGELFAPRTGTTFRPSDPCDVDNVVNAINVDAALGGQRQANCVTQLQSIGVNPFDTNGVYNFEDPLSAAFGGITSGNPDLTEETATTLTVGFVFEPFFVPGLRLSADYFDIEIEDGIRFLGAQDIVDNCYDATALNPTFCDQFTRQTDTESPQFGGFNFLETIPLNFAKLEAAGIDFSGSYGREIGEFDLNFTVVGTWNDKLDLFSDITDLTNVDPELGETGRPEWIVNTGVTVGWRDLSLGYSLQYLSEQTEAGVEIEDLDTLFGPIGIAGNAYRHDVEFSYDVRDGIQLYGGINNLTDERPFRTQIAYPFSPRGRFLFVGASFNF